METQKNETDSRGRSFRREIGVFGGISIIAGIMIGSGIFYLGSYVLQRTHYNMGLALICWVVGGIVSILGGICFAELGAAKPKAGGMVVYLDEAYHPIAGCMYGFSEWLVESSGSIAAIAVAIPTALISFFPNMSQFEIKAFAIALIIIFTAYNCIGVKQVSVLQNVLLIAKLFPIVLIIVGALFIGSEQPKLQVVPVNADGSPVSIVTMLAMIAFATVATLWAYEGWTNLNSVAEEIKNVQRNLPLSLIIGIGGVGIIYVVFNFALYKVIPAAEIKGMIESGNLYVGTEVAKRLFGNFGSILVVTGMLVSMLGSLNGMTLAFSRIYYAMAVEGHFFKSHAKLSRRGVPSAALISQAVIAIILVCLRNLDQLTSMVVFVGMIFNVMVVISVMIYRKKYPDMNRPYKVWGYPVTVIITIILFFSLMINDLMEDPVTALIGLTVPAIGAAFYFYFEHRNKKEAETEMK